MHPGREKNSRNSPGVLHTAPPRQAFPQSRPRRPGRGIQGSSCRPGCVRPGAQLPPPWCSCCRACWPFLVRPWCAAAAALAAAAGPAGLSWCVLVRSCCRPGAAAAISPRRCAARVLQGLPPPPVVVVSKCALAPFRACVAALPVPAWCAAAALVTPGFTAPHALNLAPGASAAGPLPSAAAALAAVLPAAAGPQK